MRVILEIAWTGLAAIGLHPQRSLVTLVCLLAILVPYLVGIGISQGVQADAELSIAHGADLYVSGERFGRATSVPLALVAEIAAIDGVRQVTPRIVGPLAIGSNREPAVVVGLNREVAAEIAVLEGRIYSPGSRGELVLGSELARRLRVRPGDRLPPFYQGREHERVSQVVGVFHSDISIWQSHVMLTSFETAAEIFGQPGEATELLVDCRAGYAPSVRREILQRAGEDRLRVTGRAELTAVLPRGLLHREGIFSLHFLLFWIAAILVVLVTSGIGMNERRREIGILKATGWQTDQVLLRSLAESLLISLAGAALAIVITFVWLRGFNGALVASLFLAEVDAYPRFSVPFRLTPMPSILAFIFALLTVMSGSLYSTWRSAIVPPRQAMQ